MSLLLQKRCISQETLTMHFFIHLQSCVKNYWTNFFHFLVKQGRAKDWQLVHHIKLRAQLKVFRDFSYKIWLKPTCFSKKALFALKNFFKINYNPAGNYMFKVNNRDTRTRCKICSNLTIMTTKRHQWRRSGVFIANFEDVSHLVLFLLLTLSRQTPTRKWNNGSTMILW